MVQVAWFRHLISFQMELADKKCRPSGSPPRDSGFAALQSRICAFPEHDKDCKFAEYFRRCHSFHLAPTFLAFQFFELWLCSCNCLWI